MIRLDLKPLSVNRAWQGRRFKTQEYRDWAESAKWLLRGSSPFPIVGKAILTVRWYLKTAERSDIDNPLKALLDALVRSNTLKDDRQVWRLIVEKHKSEAEYIEIEIEPFDESHEGQQTSERNSGKDLPG